MDGKPHIGQMIKAELLRQGKTSLWFAEQLGCTYMNVYKIYNRSWITTDQLFTISHILEHDFFADLSQFCKSI